MEQKQPSKWLCTLLLFIVAAIWGSGFIASQMALDAHASPEFIMFVRFTLAALIVLVAFGKRLRTRMKKQDILPGMLVGLFLFLGFYIQIIALQYTTPSNNAFITASNVVMVPFIWWVISKKRPENKIFAASVLCLAGIAILSVKWSVGLQFSPGDLLTLLCAFLFACQIAATGKCAEKTDTVVLVFIQFAVASLLACAVFFITDRDFTAFSSPTGFGSVIYLAVFSTCLCYFLQTAAQRYVSSSKVALILSTESLFGCLFSVLLGYDRLTVAMVVGGTVMMLSLLLTELRFPARAEKAALENAQYTAENE